MSHDRWHGMHDLRLRYVDGARSDVDELVAIANASADTPNGPSGIRFRKLAHDLKGSGGSYGFPRISDRAGELEAAYKAGADAEVLRDGLQTLAQAVDQARDEMKAST